MREQLVYRHLDLLLKLRCLEIFSGICQFYRHFEILHFHLAENIKKNIFPIIETELLQWNSPLKDMNKYVGMLQMQPRDHWCWESVDMFLESCKNIFLCKEKLFSVHYSPLKNIDLQTIVLQCHSQPLPAVEVSVVPQWNEKKKWGYLTYHICP